MAALQWGLINGLDLCYNNSPPQQGWTGRQLCDLRLRSAAVVLLSLLARDLVGTDIVHRTDRLRRAGLLTTGEVLAVGLPSAWRVTSAGDVGRSAAVLFMAPTVFGAPAC
jgi:hypothetical protein